MSQKNADIRNKKSFADCVDPIIVKRLEQPIRRGLRSLQRAEYPRNCVDKSSIPDGFLAISTALGKS